MPMGAINVARCFSTACPNSQPGKMSRGEPKLVERERRTRKRTERIKAQVAKASTIPTSNQHLPLLGTQKAGSLTPHALGTVGARPETGRDRERTGQETFEDGGSDDGAYDLGDAVCPHRQKNEKRT